MYQVTFIGKTTLKTRTLNQEQIDQLAKALNTNLFNLMQGIEPAYVVKRIENCQSSKPVAHPIEAN